MIRYSISMLIIAILTLVTITVALTIGKERRRSISDGVWVGVLGGLTWLSFITLIASPSLKLPWFAIPGSITTLLVKELPGFKGFHLDLVSFVIGVFLLLIFTGAIGGTYAYLLRTFEPQRVILSGIFYGLTIWSLLHLFIFSFFPLGIVMNTFPPVWLAISFGVYGLLIGTIFSYLPGWLTLRNVEKKQTVNRIKKSTRKRKKTTRKLRRK